MQLNADLDAGRDGSPLCLLHTLLHVDGDRTPFFECWGTICPQTTNHFLLLSGLTTLLRADAALTGTM